MKKLFLLLSALLLMFPMAAGATALTFGLDYEFSGGTAPEGTSPWISATFDDSFGGSNTVRLTMSTSNLVDNEFVSQWYFNFDPALDPTLLSFSSVGTLGSVPNSISTGVNAFKADGDGHYDILFDFPPPPGDFASKFTTGESVIYDITYTSAITALSFDFLSDLSTEGHGPFSSAAHVQGIGAGDEYSGWIAPGNGNGGRVPEPATMLLFSAGLGCLGVFRKKFRK